MAVREQLLELALEAAEAGKRLELKKWTSLLSIPNQALKF
jgi:hypothetical protein